VPSSRHSENRLYITLRPGPFPFSLLLTPSRCASDPTLLLRCRRACPFKFRCRLPRPRRPRAHCSGQAPSSTLFSVMFSGQAPSPASFCAAMVTGSCHCTGDPTPPPPPPRGHPGSASHSLHRRPTVVKVPALR
jgi:hypothetical protein